MLLEFSPNVIIPYRPWIRHGFHVTWRNETPDLLFQRISFKLLHALLGTLLQPAIRLMAFFFRDWMVFSKNTWRTVEYIPGNSLVTCLRWLNWPFKGLSDLQLGNQKVTDWITWYIYLMYMYIIYVYPWTPKTWKMKVSIPKHMGYKLELRTPKNDGCGSPCCVFHIVNDIVVIWL